MDRDGKHPDRVEELAQDDSRGDEAEHVDIDLAQVRVEEHVDLSGFDRVGHVITVRGGGKPELEFDQGLEVKAHGVVLFHVHVAPLAKEDPDAAAPLEVDVDRSGCLGEAEEKLDGVRAAAARASYEPQSRILEGPDCHVQVRELGVAVRLHPAFAAYPGLRPEDAGEGLVQAEHPLQDDPR